MHSESLTVILSNSEYNGADQTVQMHRPSELMWLASSAYSTTETSKNSKFSCSTFNEYIMKSELQ